VIQVDPQNQHNYKLRSSVSTDSCMAYLEQRYIRADDAPLGRLRAFKWMDQGHKEEWQEGLSRSSQEGERVQRWRIVMPRQSCNMQWQQCKGVNMNIDLKRM
jgi:hypothetical protein